MAATLGVDTIQHTNGTTAVTVGTNGSVTAAGTLGVTGASTLTGNTTVGGTLGVTGVTTLTGNVGIGTASPAHNLEIVSTASGSVNDTLQIRNNATGTGTGSRIRFINSTDATSDTNGASIASVRTGNDNDLRFETENAERMRIFSDGRIAKGITGNILGADITHQYNSVNGMGLLMHSTETSGNNHTQIGFRRNNSMVGYINTTGSSTAYVTSSDYRLKENVVYDWDATTRLKQLKPARFNFIVDADKTVDGFLAHEVSSTVPEAITGTKDAVDDNGDAVMQGIDQSKLVPLLIKTIQELEARITALEA